jgi:hypothetical protein
MVSWLEQVVPDPERCRLLAHMTLALLAGMMQLQHPPDPDLINTVARELIHNNIGIELLPDGTQRPQDLTVEASPPPRRTGRRKTTSPAG